jgi:hypothetical protein
MDVSLEELLRRNSLLEKENTELKKELDKTKEQLEITIAKQRKYYETHRQEQIQRVKEYREKTNYTEKIPKEKKKEYARTAYLKKKEKERIRKEQEEKDKKEREESTI